jgi:citrate lyase subunit beta/citryl-CoA lyase
LNEVFTPDDVELKYAKRVVDAYHAALQSGQGAVSLDGKMLDVPVVERARQLLVRAERLRTLATPYG